MRRLEKEITDKMEIARNMDQAAVCRIALVNNDYPYVVPVNCAVHGEYLYFHCAGGAKKLICSVRITVSVLKWTTGWK